MSQWKKELTELLPRAGENASIDEKILWLDNMIENSIDGTSALSSKLKHELNDTSRVQVLIDKIDELISKE